MQVGQIRTSTEGLSDDVEIFIAWYDKDEANEHIQNNVLQGQEWDDSKNLTEDEWRYVVNKMGNDEDIWQVLNESFAYFVEEIIQKRERVTNDNSK